jgi:hypothetical protein
MIKHLKVEAGFWQLLDKYQLLTVSHHFCLCTPYDGWVCSHFNWYMFFIGLFSFFGKSISHSDM